MDNNGTNKNGFSYSYSAKEQATIKKIREKYEAPSEKEDKMARLVKLDASVTSVSQAIALVFGIVSTLILGSGMSLIMTDIAEKISLGDEAAMFIGIALGVVGGVLASLAYPIYNLIVKARRKRIAPEIIRLTEELMK